MGKLAGRWKVHSHAYSVLGVAGAKSSLLFLKLEFSEIGRGPNERYQMQRKGQTYVTLLLDGVVSWLLILSYERTVSCE